MRCNVCCALFVIITLVVSVVGCSGGIKDKPLPMSQENIEKFTKELKKATKSIAPSPSQDGDEYMTGIYKMIIEKKLGFSFDKTIRSVMVFPNAAVFLGSITVYVQREPKKALDKGFISQRTFDLLDTGSKVHAPLTKEGEEFLGFVAECQNKNNGVCIDKVLLSVLAAHNALPAARSSDSEREDLKLANISYQLGNKYQLSYMGQNKWITKPDGQDFNTNFLFSQPDSPDQYVVNKSQIDISKRYTNMLEEEKVALSK